MKKKLVLSIVVFSAMIFLTGCGKPTDQKNTQEQKENQSQQLTEEKTKEIESNNEEFEGGSLSASLKELMGMGKSMKCDWTISEGEGAGSGIIYVDGEKFREELTIIEDGENIATNVISNGEWIYQWSSDSKEGTKMQLTELEKISEETEETETSDLPEDEGMWEDFNEKVDYKCEKWKADDSKFSPPSDVQFSDMTQMVKDMQENSQQMMQNMCQMCESLPAEAKAECLKNCQ